MNKIKTVFAMVALLISVNCKAQQSFFQHSGSDTLTIFYNSSSDITLEKYADYFRVAAIDPISLLFHGQFTDYDMQGDIIFSGSFINGKLDGVSSYYYKNGNIKETGRFNKGVRDSIWTYYFPD